MPGNLALAVDIVVITIAYHDDGDACTALLIFMKIRMPASKKGAYIAGLWANPFLMNPNYASNITQVHLKFDVDNRNLPQVHRK